MEHAIEKLDFFQIKMLEGKQGTLYIRDGKAYIYQGSDKYHLTEGFVGEYVPRAENAVIADKPMDLSKDVKVEGFFWLYQNEEHFAMAFIDSTRKHPALLLRAGNALDSLKEANRE